MKNNFNHSTSPPLILIFAATDGTGGAGVVADCRAVEIAGGIPLAVITAMTAQNLNGVLQYWTLSPMRVRAQFHALAKANVAAVKIGVVGNATIAVADCIATLDDDIPVVWDPVLSPTGGAAFADKQQQKRMLKYLLPRADVITPNCKELAALSGRRQIFAGAQTLLAAGGRRVLLTDAKIDGKTYCQMYAPKKNAAKAAAALCWSVNILQRAGEYHGGGCFFSSVLAARLATGEDFATATKIAQQMTLAAVDNSLAIPQLGKQRLLRPPK